MRWPVAWLAFVLLVGCVQPEPSQEPPAAPPEDASTTGPSASASATSSSTATSSPTQGPAPTATNATGNETEASGRPAPRDTGMMFDVATDVPAHDLGLVKYGLAWMGDYLESDMGGDIPADRRAEVTVKVVATGQGNQSPSAGGSGATAFAEEADGNMRPFFDVKHPQWVDRWGGWPADIQREQTVAHEYVHGWQNTLGCISAYDQPLGNWVNEGIAQQVSYAPLIADGIHTREEVLAFMEQSAKAGDGAQWDTPLWMQEDTNSGIWSGHIGHLALELALDGHADLMPLKTICLEAAAGADLDAAFATAFGQDLNQFYIEFEAWKATRP